MVPSTRNVLQSAAFYPVTGLYLGGVAIGAAVADALIDVVTGIIIFFLLAVVALLFAAWRELKAVHRLLDDRTVPIASNPRRRTSRRDRMP